MFLLTFLRLPTDLTVRVRGDSENAKFLLRLIVETLESLMKSWFQVPYTQYVFSHIHSNKNEIDVNTHTLLRLLMKSWFQVPIHTVR